jgi:hypothetical protein
MAQKLFFHDMDFVSVDTRPDSCFTREHVSYPSEIFENDEEHNVLAVYRKSGTHFKFQCLMPSRGIVRSKFGSLQALSKLSDNGTSSGGSIPASPRDIER